MVKKVRRKANINDFNFLYMSLSDARRELERRWNDKNLREKVEKFFSEIPDVFSHVPRAVLSRHIITPDKEFEVFLKLAKKIKLNPLGLEGIEDKFCTVNPDKVAFGRICFAEEVRISKGVENYRKTDIIDINGSEGKKLNTIKTFWGENLVDFHHRLLDDYCKIELFDDFEWMNAKKIKISVKNYYRFFFGFFICHGILFENFLRNKEKEFIESVVIPEFKKAEKCFGVKPLIVPLVDQKYEDSLYWSSFHPRFRKNIKI